MGSSQQQSTTPTDGEPPAPATKIVRSRRGCFECRKRKVKCDERQPLCAQCEKGDRTCEWPKPGEIHRNKRRRTAGDRRDTSMSQPAGEMDMLDFEALFNGNGNGAAGEGEQAARRSSVPRQEGDIRLNDVGSTSGDSSSFNVLQQILPAHLSVQDPQALFDPFHNAQHSHYPFIPHNEDHPEPPGPSKRRKRRSSTPDRSSQDDFSDLLIAPARQAELMADSAFLAPYFPRVHDRLVMRHYLLHSCRIIMAYDSPRHPWNPWVLLHAPAALKSLPGVSLAEDALRIALLAIGGVHMRYGGMSKDALGAWKITHHARTQVWSSVRRTSVWEGGPRDARQEEELDVVLAALLGCTIASSLAADDLWHEFLMSVISFLHRLGGPASLLRHERRDRMSLRRFCLEQLATREVFGCMSTDQAPRILTPEFERSFLAMERWSASEKEWESIDKMFGMSRHTVCVIAKVCRLLAIVRENNYHLTEDPSPAALSADPSTIQLRLPAKAVARLTHTPRLTPLPPLQHQADPTSSVSPPELPIPIEQSRESASRDANALLREFQVWESTSSFNLAHPRTAAGDHVYRHTLRLRMLREVFRLPMGEERVQQAVRAIMEIAKEVLAWYGRIVWMTWPILAAGFSMFPGDPSRTAALELLCEFEPHACFDNAAACRALLEFWRYNDASEDDLLPTEVFRRLESRPFLD